MIEITIRGEYFNYKLDDRFTQEYVIDNLNNNNKVYIIVRFGYKEYQYFIKKNSLPNYCYYTIENISEGDKDIYNLLGVTKEELNIIFKNRIFDDSRGISVNLYMKFKKIEDLLDFLRYFNYSDKSKKISYYCKNQCPFGLEDCQEDCILKRKK